MILMIRASDVGIFIRNLKTSPNQASPRLGNASTCECCNLQSTGKSATPALSDFYHLFIGNSFPLTLPSPPVDEVYMCLKAFRPTIASNLDVYITTITTKSPLSSFSSWASLLSSSKLTGR